MADEAYWNSIEEFQRSTDRYRGSSSYDVVKIGTGKLLGTICSEATADPLGPALTCYGGVYG